eukprot:TRINITY_DN6000_c0_g1_i1.p1 TRINITY_DN6000_c0_g1~~TRINITY_DN6000_c0_g1_i1.p1  ORF type:complete len:424 (-),score=55.07 TRINITY_DN6000_c0_g1_i1:260-1531(-)
MRGVGGLGQQGMGQSRNFSFDAGTICKAPIKVSYYLFIYAGFQLYTTFSMYRNAETKMLLFGLGMASAQFVVLYLTVLTHEFGHGNMARWLGGEIHHILLWPLGGICFSTRPEETDARKMVKNDFKVVAAGPATHIPQVLVWACVAMLVIALVNLSSECSDRRTYFDGTYYDGCFPCDGISCFPVVVNMLSPAFMASNVESLWLRFFYMVPLMAIELNVALFLFNVLFPMYPMDGAKLLVSSLMYCCGVRPYTAARVLIYCSSICGVLLVAWGIWSFQQGIGSAGLSAFTGILPALLGFMALQESYTIWDLKERRQLSQHPYFRAAQTHIVRTGARSAGLNATGLDDPDQILPGRPAAARLGDCCFCRMCCLPRFNIIGARQEQDDEDALPAPLAGPQSPEAQHQMRSDRGRFLESLETARRQ